MADPTPISRWGTNNEGVGGDIPSHHGPRRHEGICAQTHAAYDGGIGSNCHAVFNLGCDGLEALRITRRARAQIVGEGCVGANKNIIAETNAFPDLNPILDRAVVSDDCFGLDETPPSNITSATNPSPLHHMGKGPDPGSRTNLLALAESK